MSNVTIVNGEEVNIQAVNQIAQGLSIVDQPTTSISVAGLVGKSDAHYKHSQNTNSDVWVVQHNLKKYPSVTVVDSGNNVVYAEVQYIDENNLEIRFNGATSGKAYMN